MASIGCNFGGHSSYNNGWTKKYFITAAGHGYAGFGKDRYGRYRCTVVKLTTPNIPNTYINKRVQIKLPMCRSSAAGSGTDTLNYRITTTAPTFSEGGATHVALPSSYLCSGTIDVYNDKADNGYTVRQLTSVAGNFVGNTTYYVWFWSDTPYYSGSSSYTIYYAHEESFGGTISASLIYDLQEKSTLKAGNGTLGTTQTLTVTKQDSSYTHTLTFKTSSNATNGSPITTTICTKSSSTSLSWTPPLTYAECNRTGTSVSGTFTLTTYNGSTTVGSNTYSATYTIPASVKPSCTISVSDSTGNLTKYGSYVKGLSKLSVSITPTLAYGSSISAYRTTIKNDTYSSSSFTTPVISSTGTITVSSTVTDARGRTSAAATKDITAIDYNPPVISSLTVHRCDSDGTENPQGEHVKVTFSATVTSLNSKNTASYVLRRKKSTDSSYTSTTLTALDGQYSVTGYSTIIAADSGSSYDIEIEAIDAHNSTTRSTSASTAFTLMHWKADGTALSIGKISERSNSFEVGVTQYDKFGTLAGNGLAAYGSASEGMIDANTTIEPLILTTTNTPIANTFFYIQTVFYSTKSETANRAQMAIPYKTDSDIYHRHYVSGTWTEWKSVAESNVIGDYIIDRGTSGAWMYEKWKSGKCELWYTQSIANRPCTTAVGSMYRTTEMVPGAFPFTVYNPILTANYEATGFIGILCQTTTVTTTALPNYYILRPTSTTITKGRVTFHVVGTTSPLTITTQPSNRSGATGTNVTFSVAASGTGLTYKWQWANTANTTWSDSGLSTSNTSSLSVPCTADRNTQLYRCVIKDTYGNVIVSDAAMLTVTS